ncbi:putative transcriptional regulator YvhJ [Calidithermus terrae]|uniref:Putative transcriptional regulator YvhJ n=1 Tax=Calidithermus terrae TaxID=1408545 RepID=A0A399ENB3_9DEIN|nr:putative transcriptional regulator YvhJ [Calidithermus terrae]
MRRPRASLILLSLAFFGLAAAIHFAPEPGDLRHGGGGGGFRVGDQPEMSLVIAARDIQYCGYHTPCGPGDRTDTIFYATARGSEVSLVALPRDLYTPLTGGKINGAYARGKAQGLVDAVEDALGLPVDHYVILTIDVVKVLVDAVDGVDVVLPEPMQYTDRAAGLFIDFPAGPNHFDGADAVKYMRFRHGYGSDYSRLDRIKDLLSQVAEKIKQPKYWSRLPGLANQLWGKLETDLSVQDALAWLPYLRGVSLRSATLPTYEDGVFLRYDEEERNRFLSEFFSLDLNLLTGIAPEGKVAVLRPAAGERVENTQSPTADPLEGFRRLGLPLPEVVENTSGLGPGVYIRTGTSVEVARYYAELLHLPLFTRYTVDPPGYDALIVLPDAGPGLRAVVEGR